MFFREGLRISHTAEERQCELLVAVDVVERSAMKQRMYHVMTELMGDFVKKRVL